MTDLVVPRSSVFRLGETYVIRDHTKLADDTVESETEAEAKASKQRRKIQNRKNQRAHRLRIKGQVQGSLQATPPFQVRRWRIDEQDNDPFRDNSPILESTSASYATPWGSYIHVSASTGPSGRHVKTSLTPPSVIFPLSTDHLLHLVQYNVFRAFVSNKRTLNILLTGWTGKLSSPNLCPLGRPYRDGTSVYPLNPNIPLALFPTRLQQSRLHSIWINFFPFPSMRDNLIKRDGCFNHWDLLGDLIGELMSATPPQERHGTPAYFTVSDPNTNGDVPLRGGRDEDEVTGDRKGLIVWGEPHEAQSWEATPGFFAKWPWVVKGCNDLLESSNRWRTMRGEDPICISL